MVRDSRASGAETGPDSKPDLAAVLDALDDADCRTIVTTIEEPMTASEIAEAADVPLSTTYRKLEVLSDASLLDERTRIRSDGRHATQYLVAFDEVSVRLTEDRELVCRVDRPPESPDERLAALWSEVQKETQS